MKKNELVHAEGAILVDDFSRNLYAWEEAGGIPIKFSNDEHSEFVTISSLKELQENEQNHTKNRKKIAKCLRNK